MYIKREYAVTVSNLIVASGCLAFPTIALADHPTLGLQQEGAGAVTTLTAMTLPGGASAVGFETQHLSNNEIDDIDLAHFAEDGEQVHSVASLSNLSLNAAYGLTDNLTIGLNLPYVTRTGLREGIHHHEEHEEVEHLSTDSDAITESPEISYLGDASGLGDLSFYSQYRFIGDSDSRKHASVLLGIKMPTGKTNVSNDEGHRFEAEHQPGSGSWDLLAGLAFTRQWSQMVAGESRQQCTLRTCRGWFTRLESGRCLQLQCRLVISVGIWRLARSSSCESGARTPAKLLGYCR